MIGKRFNNRRVFPEQEAYERLRPIVLFGETAASRAKETGVSERTLHYQADQFERYGMVSLFPKVPAPPPDPGQRLPPELRQLIVDLKAEHPAFRPHEIAPICYVRYGRKPSDHTVKRILAEGPISSVTTRRYPPYAKTRRSLPAPTSHCRSARPRLVEYEHCRLPANASPPGV